MAKDPDFQPLPLALTGSMDSRSRPADLLPGYHRFKLNLAISRVGKLIRRSGFAALTFGDGPNWDHHRAGHSRGPKTLLHDSVGNDSVHRLFDSDNEVISVLDNDTGEWTDIKTGLTGTGRVRAATLVDTVYFTDNVSPLMAHVIGSGTTVAIPMLGNVNGPDEATGISVEAAKLIMEFNGVVVIMNTLEDGTRQGGRIRWSAYLDGMDWDPSVSDPVTGFLDLPYSEGEILNAIPFNGQIYIFTAGGIFRLFITDSGESIFGVAPVYTEPRNRTGCLAYENTLCSDGKALYWAGRETIYTIDQYRAAPVSEEWMLKASGRMFEGDEAIDPRCCTAPVAEFEPNTKELWFSYPRKSTEEEPSCLNDYCLVLHKNDDLATPIRTADYVDYGFTAFVNFARRAVTGEVCNSSVTFIAASAVDYCLKSIGGVFSRAVVNLIGDDPAADISDAAYVVTAVGYSSRIVGTLPLGYPTREKVIRQFVLEHDTVEQDVANIVRLRIGGSFKLADPMDVRPVCSVLWRTIEPDLELSCPDEATIAAMQAANQKQSDSTLWNPYEQANYLHYDVSVLSPTGGLPIGSDSAWNTFTVEVQII